MTIGQRIKERRVFLKLTQEDVATIVEVTKQTIQKYENNIISNIPSDKIELLAKALKCSPGFIMGWEKETIESKKQQDDLIEAFSSLSEEDQKKAIEYIKLLKKAAE